MSAKLLDILIYEMTQIRQSQKVSLSALAQRMKTDSKHLWRLEKGKINPTLRTIDRYVELLGYRIEFKITKREALHE